MSGQPYSAELRAVELQLTELNTKVKNARARKKELQYKLYDYMKKNKVEEIEGYSIDKIKPRTPKPKEKKKPKTQQRKDAIALFRQVGILNPESLYDEFEMTTK